MLQSRFYRFIISAVLSVILMIALVAFTSDTDPSRILTMLGGTMPEGIIQGVTYFLFIFGMLEIYVLLNRLSVESDAFNAHFLPEKENWVMDVDDVNQLKLNMQQIEHTNKYYLTDLIKKACIKYRLNKSSSEVLGLVESQVKIYNSNMESEQSFISYVAWAIPSVGFIGTVLGIAASLGFANQATTPEGIEKVTSMLAVAFDTTLVALVLSLILMYFIHYLHKRQDAFFARLSSYLIENLINRLYK